jgi:cell pole-organizing protein PopZ
VEFDSFRVEQREPDGGRTPEAAEVTLQPQPTALAGPHPETAWETPPARVEPAGPMYESAALDELSGAGTEAGLADDLDIEDDLREDSHPTAAEMQPARPAPKLRTTPMQLDEPYLPPEPKAMLAGIMSEHAGRQVAAAFGELSEAFTASRKRSFDEMAEEMMRPMLQDWLDNNLPLLVERLVREEIERVARGVR